MKTVATLNHAVFSREIFGILLNVLKTSQTLSLLDTVNEVIFLALLDVQRLKGFQLQAPDPLTRALPLVATLPLDPAGGSAPRPPL